MKLMLIFKKEPELVSRKITLFLSNNIHNIIQISIIFLPTNEMWLQWLLACRLAKV